MGYEENRAAKPFSGTPLLLIRVLWHSFKNWQLRRETRIILSRLSDKQLKDIGISRDEWNKLN